MKTILFNVWSYKNDSARPNGVYRIATILRQNNWDVEVIDFFSFWPPHLLKKYIQSKITKDTKFIGFSFIFAEYDEVFKQFVQWFKSEYPDIKIITGSSSNFKQDFELVDYHIRGYGEVALIELLKYLFSNGTKPKFNLNQSNKHTKKIDANVFYQAFPMKELMQRYADNDFLEPDEWLGLETSRGCIFECAFCSYPVLGVKGDYTRSVEDFEMQLRDNYDRFGITNYTIVDETFNDSTKKIIKYADVVEKLPFETYYVGCLRPELLVTRPNDKEHLLRMNFVIPFFGIESFNHESRIAIGKGMHPDKVKQALLDTKQYFKTNKKGFFKGTISLISGLPGETAESFNETIEWIKNNWQNNSVICYKLFLDNDDFNKPSKMTLNYKKYGYEQMSLEEIEKYKDQPDFRSYDSTEHVVWKNKNMNIFQADRLVDKILPYGGGLGDYQFGSLFVKGTFEERLKMTHTHNINYEIFSHRVRTYISKKINN